jgi:hypothetical protein
LAAPAKTTLSALASHASVVVALADRLTRVGRWPSEVEMVRFTYALVMLWSLGATSACARVDDQLMTWGSCVASSSCPERRFTRASSAKFFGPEVAREGSHPTIEDGRTPIEGAVLSTTDMKLAPVSASIFGQLLINPDDLNQTSGELVAGPVAFG